MTTATAPRTATSHRERGRARGRRTVSVRAVVFVAVALAALYLAYWRIGEQNPYTDEVTYMRAGWEYLHGIATANLEHPPTAKYLYGLSQYVVGRGVLGPRIVASTASLGVGVVLLLWLRRPLGWWGPSSRPRSGGSRPAATRRRGCTSRPGPRPGSTGSACSNP
ncbi:hypothetical protein P9139_10505 [Curtobacterium flaccumfaciens]|nr:hypothetical protein P9139_10505 [Curtobacterium flaccumfaciens]